MTDADIRAQAADLIDGALDVLAENGWCQGNLRDGEGRLCAIGALDRAVSCSGLTYGDAVGIWDEAFAAVVRECGVERIQDFNDHPETTVEDVTLTFKRAAHSLRTEVA